MQLLKRTHPWLLLLITGPLFGQTASHDDSERRIHELETRLARVEAQMEALLSERGNTPATERVEEAVPASPGHKSFEMPPELVPEIGKIGAETGLLISGATSPFRLDAGAFYGGFIDLPLVDKPDWLHGKISYEIVVGLSRSRTQMQTTSNVAQVANLAVLNTLNPNGGLANVTAALAGAGSAPFPVTTSSQLNMRLLQVIPFALKYTATVFDRWRLRPYAVLGFGTYVTIHDEVPASAGVRPDADLPPSVLAALQQTFAGKAPFGTALVAGQIGQAPELVARGMPGGNGNLDIGLQSGGGFELRLSRTISIGFDGRFNKVSGSNGNFGTYGSRIGFHF